MPARSRWVSPTLLSNTIRSVVFGNSEMYDAPRAVP
jgi:hypothetical protein